MDLFCKDFVIDKPIRLVELFAGIGAQAMALRDCGAKFEHHRVVEFDQYAMRSYNAIHGTNFEPTDIRDVTATDLGIVDTDQYCYILTYSFPCQSLSVAGKRVCRMTGRNRCSLRFIICFLPSIKLPLGVSAASVRFSQSIIF